MNGDTPLSARGQEPNARRNWGMMGYRGACIDLAVAIDDDEAIREAHRRDWIDRDTVTLLGWPIRKLCRSRGKVKCEAALAELGYPAEVGDAAD